MMRERCLINRKYANTVIRERERDIHKGDCGKVLVIAGSKGMAGAAILCARGALRAGAGLVRISAPEELYTILQIAVPEATCVSRNLLELKLWQYDAVAIGPGLGDDFDNAELIRVLLGNYTGTIVFDADALNTLAQYGIADALKLTDATVIITPHMGEAKRLIESSRRMDYDEPQEEKSREELAEDLAELTGAITVLKGANTIVVADGDEYAYINTTGNPGMATGGSGDVLTGVIAALVGQLQSPLDAAMAGVFLHGMGGDYAASELGEYGMTSMDVADGVAFAIKKILTENK